MEQERISGNADWQERSFFVPAGTHTLTWQYDKVGSDTYGTDGGWVDQVVWQSQARQHFDALQPVSGYAQNRWSFITAWNLSTGLLEMSPRWRNGVYTWAHSAGVYRQWIARFTYNETTGQTTALAWYYRQVYVQ